MAGVRIVAFGEIIRLVAINCPVGAALRPAGYAFGQVSEKVMSDASSGLGLAMLVAFLGLSWILSKKLELSIWMLSPVRFEIASACSGVSGNSQSNDGTIDVPARVLAVQVLSSAYL